MAMLRKKKGRLWRVRAMPAPPETSARRPADLPARLIECRGVPNPDLHRRGAEIGACLHHGCRVEPAILVEVGILVAPELLRDRAGVHETGLDDLRVGIAGPFLVDVRGVV